MSDLKVNAVDVSNVKQIKDKNAATNGTQKKAATKLTATNVTLGGLGALGAIGAAILAVKHGKAAKALKEIGVEGFKEAGNFFEKGKAFTNKGKPFTGVITQKTSKGYEHHLRYEKGVLKEVEKFHVVETQGQTAKLPLGRKGYNYTPEGKLESVDKYNWVHVNTRDPKTHGFQYIKTSETNLDQQRANGLKNFAEKKKQEAINKYVDGIRKQLSGKPKVSAETIDNSFNNFSIDDYGYRQMKRNYKNWEQNEQNIKENVVKLKEKMHTKTEINAEKIDRQFDTKNSESNAEEVKRLSGLFSFLTNCSAYFATCYGECSAAVKSDLEEILGDNTICNNRTFWDKIIPHDKFTYDDFISVYADAFQATGLEESLQNL